MISYLMCCKQKMIMLSSNSFDLPEINVGSRVQIKLILFVVDIVFPLGIAVAVGGGEVEFT